MSLWEVQRFLFELNRATGRGAAFSQAPYRVVAEWDGQLTAREQDLLAACDVVGLYRHGVHGVLLAVTATALGTTPQQVRQELKAAYGLDEKGQPVPNTPVQTAIEEE